MLRKGGPVVLSGGGGKSPFWFGRGKLPEVHTEDHHSH